MTSNPDGLLPSAKEVKQKIALAEAEEAEQEARKRAEAQVEKKPSSTSSLISSPFPTMKQSGAR